MRSIAISCGIWAALLGAGALAQDEEAGAKIVIGDRFPLATECYERARDGATSAAGLAPCDASLAAEPLTDRRRAIVYANRGVIQFNSGDYTSAIVDFTASLDLGVFAAGRVYANRGLAYEVLRYEALARADYQMALALSPNNDIARRRLAELEKPLYERSQVPHRITAEAAGEDADQS